MVALDHHHIVLVNEFALVHVQREAAAGTAERIQDAGSASFASSALTRITIAFATKSGRRQIPAAGSSSRRSPVRVRSLDAIFRMETSQMPAPIGKSLFAFASFKNRPFICASSLGSLAARSSACEKSLSRS